MTEKIKTETIKLDNGEEIEVDADPQLCMVISYDRVAEVFIPLFFDEEIQKHYTEGHEIDFVTKITEAIDDYVESYIERLNSKQKKE